MHTHKFIFTYEGHAICEEPSCNYRFTLSEIKEILASIANKHAVEHTLAPDGAVCPAHQTYFEADGTCAIAGCKETRPASNA